MKRLGLLLVMLAAIFASTVQPSNATQILMPAKWGAVGDSITYGWGSTGCSSFPGSGETCPNAYANVAGVPHLGYPGQCLVATNCWYTPLAATTATGTRFGDEIATLKAQGVNSVVVEIGVNDISSGTVTDAQMEAAYQSLLTTGATNGVHVVLSTLTPMGNDAHPLATSKYNQRQRINAWIRSQSEYVEYALPLQIWGKGQYQPQYDSGDGIHPSDAGHAVMANTLKSWMANHTTALSAPAHPPVQSPVSKASKHHKPSPGPLPSRAR